jgi:large subunit ribosomal protein L30
MLKIRLTKGLVGKTETQRKVVAALGLGKFGSTVEHADSPTIRGMIRKVSHLVTVVPAEGNGKAKATKAEKPAAKKAATKAGA